MSQPWSLRTPIRQDGQLLIFFEYKGHAVGQFMGSIENAEWMVTCINAAHACYGPMSDAVAREAGYEDMGAVFSALMDDDA